MFSVSYTHLDVYKRQGQYLDQIDELADALGAPKLTGATPIDERERLYQEFRDGVTKVLVVSKVANLSLIHI